VTHVRSLTSFAAIFTMSLAACASKNSSSSSQSTQPGEEVSQTESDTESLGTSFVGGTNGSLGVASFEPSSGGELHVQTGGTVGNPGWFFQPAGCIQETKDAATSTNTYVFSDCTGPLGLVHLTGTITVNYQLSGNQLTLKFSASNFQINRATITSWAATAVITATGGSRDMTWNAQLTGTTGSGRSFQRTNQKDLKWTVGQACLAVSGQSTGNISGANLQTTITNYQRCADSCPQAGSEINIKNLDNGDSIDIKYLGGPDATVTINGKSQTVGLACGL
jgi:hypothetical protein